MLRCHWAAAQTWDSPYGSRWCSSSSAWVPYLVAVLLFVAGLVVLDFTVAILVLGALPAVCQCRAMASAKYFANVIIEGIELFVGLPGGRSAAAG